jgi:hypothetical protein
MLTTMRYLLLTALRDKLFFALPTGVVMITALSLFLGGTSLVEQQEMAVVYSAGLGRIYIMVGLILFICFHVRRSFENREIEMLIHECDLLVLDKMGPEATKIQKAQAEKDQEAKKALV